MMKKTIFFILLILIVSCKKDNSLEHYFTTNENEYWAWYDNSDGFFEGDYVTFNNHKYKNYFISDPSTDNSFAIKEFNKGSKGVEWSVSKDSFLTIYNDKQKIIYINDKVIVLSIKGKVTGKQKHCFLIKEKIDKDHKSSYYYEQVNKWNFEPVPTIYK